MEIKMNIGLMVTPGSGYRDVTIKSGSTVADLVSQEELFNRSITVNGNPVDSEDYRKVVLNNQDEVWATGAVKGA